jgi:uncharacterized protein (TIGR03084 family)
MPDIAPLLDDLTAEQSALDGRVAGLDDRGWHTATPAAGWDVLDSVSHLAYFDETARMALADPDAFAVHAEAYAAPGAGRDDVALGRSLGPDALLERWRTSRRAFEEAARSVEPRTRVPWYGPPMGVASFVTARIMETWAHGQDVADALGLPPVVSARLRHVCHIGVGARAYAFMIHGVTDPGDPVRVEASRPDGETWVWGPPDARDRLLGPALDMALVFTQRRHPDDTLLVADGPTASAWLAVAQCFAGPAGTGRAPVNGGATTPDAPTPDGPTPDGADLGGADRADPARPG